MLNVGSSHIKRSASALMDCREILKTSVLKLDAELILIARSMKNVIVAHRSHKPENVKDFV